MKNKETKEPRLKEKKWDKSFEDEIIKKWIEDKVNKFNKNDDRPVYSIDTPPPYVNTPIHIGHATVYTLMDMFARYRRMIGYNVLFPLGLDRNGLPIEMAAEKRFNIKFNQVSREEFLKMCKKVLDESSTKSIDYFKRLGISFNSYNIGNEIGEGYLTDSDEYRRLTQEIFIDLWNKGLIYEEERINNYCPGCKTTIADAEVEYKELPTKFNYIKFKVDETNEDIIIATTRPELLCTCAMVIFNPNDERYKHLDGKHAIVPLYNKKVPIKAHPMADMNKGTGLVMMCSAGDLSDIRFFREMGLKPVIAINVDGRMNENSGFLKGLKVKEAREKIIEMLKEKGLITKQEDIMHRTPICERSGDQIEFISMKEFYLKQTEFKEDIEKIANELNFFAPESKQILINWINSVSIDWPISRRRYYGTEIPLWYCKKCHNVIVPEKGKYYKPWKEKPPVDKCPVCGSKEFEPETRVLDTWFDSSITPLYILGYSKDKNFYNKNNVCSLRPQGKEIIRTWLYYTLLNGYLVNGKRIFNDVWIHYHVVDEKGKKMSKRIGNYIEPGEVLEKVGAEPFRFWTAMEGNLEKSDFRCSLQRIESAGKTLIKLWNVARFVSMFDNIDFDEDKLCYLDKWILNEINEIVKYTRIYYGKYDFNSPVKKIRHFLWETFASHYIELVKGRAYNKDNKFSDAEMKSAWYTLNKVLDILLKLLAPVIPIITDKIYYELNNKSIHSEEFPKVVKERNISFKTNELEELDSRIWKEKKDKGLNLKSEVKKIILNNKFKDIEKDLKVTHNIKQIEYCNTDEIKIEL